ncbi:cytochrome c oxidase subunit 7A1, mitochondrial-like [Haliaeetus albicilla]|uniref:cytochrome c oxidase subunit 7A1, mitochondrial-like n=1 Tax=Haliaeetus albicilla TaxID=8969 RepID=UPI0037E7ADFB
MHGAGCHRGPSLSRPPPPSVSFPPPPPVPFVVAEDDRSELSMRVLRAARFGLLRSLGPAAPPRHLHNRVREHQKLFQEDNGLPVHLKGGAMDSALYHFTTLVCSVGTCYSLWSLAQASRPKKN